MPCFKETIHLKGSAALLRVWEGEGLQKGICSIAK